MKIVPISLKEANAFIAKYHRHNKPVTGHKFSIGLELEDHLIGVCIVGRPIARLADNGKTLEVTRLATDGTKNANSKLYARAKQIVQLMGYTRLLTYTLITESGSSMRAIGARYDGIVKASKGWHSRKGRAKLPTEQLEKNRWILLGGELRELD
jgi:hypothetical protein